MMPTPHLPHSQKRTLQTAFFPQLSAYCVNLNVGYRKLCKKINLFLFLLFYLGYYIVQPVFVLVISSIVIDKQSLCALETHSKRPEVIGMTVCGTQPCCDGPNRAYTGHISMQKKLRRIAHD